MSARSSQDRRRVAGAPSRDAARPEPQKMVQRTTEPRVGPEPRGERATQPVKPRSGPPRPRGVR